MAASITSYPAVNGLPADQQAQQLLMNLFAPMLKGMLENMNNASAPVTSKAIEKEDSGMAKFTTRFPTPLKAGNSLSNWEYADMTRVLGREYFNIDIAAVLESPEADRVLRDIAITSAYCCLLLSWFRYSKLLYSLGAWLGRFP
jgi:hypothetical protein